MRDGVDNENWRIAMSAASRIGIVLASMICLLSARTAFAQRSFGRSSSLVSIAANDAVQAELGLSGEAAAKLKAIGDDYRSATQKEMTSLGIDYSAISDLPAAERAVESRKASERTAEVNRKLTAEFMPKLAELLSPEQI